MCGMKRPELKEKRNRNGSYLLPCFVTLNVSSPAFYQLNNYINILAFNGNAKCHLNTKSDIYGDFEKRKLPIDIIYRLLHYYQSYSFVRCYFTADYCLG